MRKILKNALESLYKNYQINQNLQKCQKIAKCDKTIKNDRRDIKNVVTLLK